ncbi:serine hydrolase [Amylibacter sp. SFDW26]|uniref:serine hydrolase domain-containing protein n=1 Tax=Amylibacter sp. SFDW26 TaxID=2652722 RepID=UPI001262260F|nr:serine hydrolase [Amylibacter sp. SFDW26]KAB7616143.1 serine hydrolase [Amylibacter sp. SFDW26]
MKRVGIIAFKTIAVLILIGAAIGIWKREEITRLMAVNSLFAEDKIVRNFSHMDQAFLNTPVPKGKGKATILTKDVQIELDQETRTWVKDRSVTSLVVLKSGDLVFEEYYQGTMDDDLRISWSVAKSFLSALVGILLEEGAIASIDDPVTKYVPLLKGSGYETATLKNVLQMSSGVEFDEDYLDKNSDINRMGREIALGGTLDGFSAGISKTFAEPGKVMQYVSIDTHVIGMVVRGATGRSVTSLLSEKIIMPLGLEKEPYYLTDGEGVAFVLGGLNLTTRDYARFGQMILQDGFYNGQQIIPKDWIYASTKASANTKAGERGYGYQWWIPAVNPRAGEFFAHGIYGQYIYIDRNSDTVIVVNSVDRGFREDGVSNHNIEIFRRITAAL